MFADVCMCEVCVCLCSKQNHHLKGAKGQMALFHERETQKGIADVPLFNKRPLKRCKVGSHFLMRHKNGVQLLYPLSSVLMFIKMCARYFFICLLAILTHTIFLLGIYCEISRYCSRDCTTPHLLHTIVCT